VGKSSWCAVHIHAHQRNVYGTFLQRTEFSRMHLLSTNAAPASSVLQQPTFVAPGLFSTRIFDELQKKHSRPVFLMSWPLWRPLKMLQKPFLEM
jgi:hypothetical protein